MNIGENIFDFYSKALLSVYDCKNFDDRPVFLDNYEQNFAELKNFETIICKKYHFHNRGIAKLIHQFELDDSWKQIHWRCDVIFDRCDPMNPKYRIDFLPPSLERATNICNEHFGCHRFVQVTISGVPSSQDNGENVTGQFWQQHWAALELFHNGINFGGNKYNFLGGELNKVQVFGNGEKDRCMNLWFFCQSPLFSEQVKDELFPKSAIYKFQRNATLPIPYHSRFSIDQFRYHLGELSALTVGKCNARLKLGFSSILPIYLNRDVVMQIIPDIESATESSGYSSLLSDGCGLIAADLLQELPYAIHHGVAHSPGPRPSHMPWPILVQIRCLCPLGLFKGCLLVTSDSSLCPSKTILFRPSMQKNAPLDNSFATQEFWRNNLPILGIVDTFEHASWLSMTSNNLTSAETISSGSHMTPNSKIIGATRDISSFSARLNRPLCLLLHARGVPSDWFLQHLHHELDKELSALSDRKKAFRVIKEWLSEKVQLLELNKLRNAFISKSVQAEEDENVATNNIEDEEDEEININEEYDDTTICGEESLLVSIATRIHHHTKTHDNQGKASTLCDEKEIDRDTNKLFGDLVVDSMGMEDIYTRMLTRPLQLLDMLLAGHAVEKDIYLQQQLRTFIFQRISYLMKCQIRISGALYLVGTPDPYRILPPNTVFIALPNDHLVRGNDVQSSETSNLLHPTGRVLVTRNPMQHPGDLRLLQAVFVPQLANLVAPSNGGAIFFSTQGLRSAADEMSGGDFDGDRYFILFDQEYIPSAVNQTEKMAMNNSNNNSLLPFIQPCDPFSDHQTSAASASSSHESSTFNAHSKPASSVGATTIPTMTNEPSLDYKGWCIFDSLLLTSQTQTIGRFANAWLSWADAFSPLCPQAIHCANIVKIALDAAKTGQKVVTPKHLWQQAPVLLWQTISNQSSSYAGINKRLPDVDKIMLLVQQYLIWRQAHDQELPQTSSHIPSEQGRTHTNTNQDDPKSPSKFYQNSGTGNDHLHTKCNANSVNIAGAPDHTTTNLNKPNMDGIHCHVPNATPPASTTSSPVEKKRRWQSLKTYSSPLVNSPRTATTVESTKVTSSSAEKKSRWQSLKTYSSPLVNSPKTETTGENTEEKEEVKLPQPPGNFDDDDEDDIISEVTFLDTVMSRTLPHHISAPQKNIPALNPSSAIFSKNHTIFATTMNQTTNNTFETAHSNIPNINIATNDDNLSADDPSQDPASTHIKNKISFLTKLHHTVLEHLSLVLVDPPSTATSTSTSTIHTRQQVCIDCSLLLVENEYAPVLTLGNNIQGFEPTNRVLYRLCRTLYGPTLLVPAQSFFLANTTNGVQSALQELFQRLSFLPMFYDIAKQALVEYKTHMARILAHETAGTSQQQQQRIDQLKRLHRKTFDQTALLLAGYYYSLYSNTNSNNIETPAVTLAEDIQKKAFLPVARARLASFYYLATYTAAVGNQSMKKTDKTVATFAVTFCWEICGAELNLLKTQFVKRSEESVSENVWTVLPRSQLIFLCGM